MTAQRANAYLKAQILTAPPEKLQLMLYEGAIRFATQSKEKIRQRDYEASCELLVKAQNIVLELICGLRPEHNASLCNRMASVYAFIYRTLVEANVHHDTAAVDDAVSVLSIQRDIWLELLDKLAEDRAAEGAEGVVVGNSVNAEA
ncbi:MAG: flagellar export chaperone FliS [Planctomycetes bacterium]|nr:flagellar export chaperone FliS [Planctomycetota bacterium]